MHAEMMTRLPLHVRRLESGRFVATLLPFTDLSFDGDSLAEVRSAARQAAVERLAELSGVLRAGVVDQGAGELELVRVRVGENKADEPIEISVGLAVYNREMTTGSVWVAYAPGVPRWSAIGSTQEQTLTVAAESLEKQVQHWSPASVLALDSAGEVNLEWLSLEPEPESESERAPRLPIAGDDMVELSRQGLLGRLDRRDPLVERALAALAAEGRASVLLVGPADVGKTALVHEIAARLANGEVPPALKGRRLVRTSANELIAGARFTGMWQERARQLITFARNTGAIIALGDPGGIVDAGRWSESDNNLGRILRPVRRARRNSLDLRSDGRWRGPSTEAGAKLYRSVLPSRGSRAGR
jgi:hypothetical protein